MGLADWVGDAVADAVHAANAAAGGLESKVDEAVIADVRDKLNKCVAVFGGDDFAEAKIAPASFGGSDHGGQLGTHHSLAQDVIQETLYGIRDDLHKFSIGVRKAADLMTEADGGAADDMKSQRAIVQAIGSGASDTHAADAYNQARNHHHYHPQYPVPTTSGGK